MQLYSPYDEGYYIGYIYIVLALCLNAKGGANMWVSVFIFQLDVEPSQSLCVTMALMGGGTEDAQPGGYIA